MNGTTLTSSGSLGYVSSDWSKCEPPQASMPTSLTRRFAVKRSNCRRENSSYSPEGQEAADHTN
jgi:hypothetical protein